MSSALEKGLYSLIAGKSPQTAAQTRVYPRVPQEPIYPLCRYQRVSVTRQQSLDSNVGVAQAVLQVDCMATSYSDAKALADEIRSTLHGYSGAWGTLTAHNTVLEMEIDTDEQEGDRVTHWVTQRYRVYTNMD